MLAAARCAAYDVDTHGNYDMLLPDEETLHKRKDVNNGTNALLPVLCGRRLAV